MSEEPAKKVDESYRQRVEDEKRRSAERGERKLPEADFLTLVASLAGQATIHLGLVAHPIAKRVAKDLKQARYTIDLLGVIEEKTRGNLGEEERTVLGNVLKDLRLRYVDASKEPAPGSSPPPAKPANGGAGG